jgi:dihydrofolate reductase
VSKLIADMSMSLGALIGGRRDFDLADGWGGRHPMGVPVYILTHEPPADWPADSTIHFVTDGLESAVAQAREVAGGKDVGIATPGVVRQCLDAGLLDELQVNVIPVVLGDGVPFFDGIEREVSLGGPEVIEGNGVTHLRYRVGVATDAGADAAEATPARSSKPAPERQRATPAGEPVSSGSPARSCGEAAHGKERRMPPGARSDAPR